MVNYTMKIFYSWQSWTGSNANRNLIEDAIKGAIKHVNAELELELAKRDELLEFDKDTQGVPGIPPIAETILKKIDECEIFVADVSFVIKEQQEKNGDTIQRISPNPNVFFELGYALSSKGSERIILVMNEKYGEAKLLPFDLAHRRFPIIYNTETKSINESLKQLETVLVEAIKLTLPHVQMQNQINVLEEFREHLQSQKIIEIENMWRTELRKSHASFTSDDFYAQRSKIVNDETRDWETKWYDILELYFKSCENFLTIAAEISWYGKDNYTELIIEALETWISRTGNRDEDYTRWRYFPALLLTYVVGVISAGRENWKTLVTILQNVSARIPDNPDKISSVQVLSSKIYVSYARERHGRQAESTLVFHIEKHTLSIVQPYFSSKENLYGVYDAFELLQALTIFYMTSHNRSFGTGTATARIAVDHLTNRSSDYLKDYWTDAGRSGSDWDLLKANWLDGTIDTLSETLQNYMTLLAHDTHRVLFGMTNYSYHYSEELQKKLVFELSPQTY